MLRTVQKMKAWLVKFQRENLRLLSGLCCFECEDFIALVSTAEESAVLNKTPELLKRNLCITGTIDAG